MDNFRLNRIRHFSIKIILGLVPVLLAGFVIFGDFDPAANASEAQGEKTEGEVLSAHDNPLGKLRKDGKVFSLHGNEVGSVDKGGIVYNVGNIVIGKVNDEGSVYNQSDTFLGRVDNEGNVYNVSDAKVGSVSNMEGDLFLLGGAARLLIFKK